MIYYLIAAIFGLVLFAPWIDPMVSSFFVNRLVDKWEKEDESI